MGLPLETFVIIFERGSVAHVASVTVEIVFTPTHSANAAPITVKDLFGCTLIVKEIAR
jgi:hypothetical protein